MGTHDYLVNQISRIDFVTETDIANVSISTVVTMLDQAIELP